MGPWLNNIDAVLEAAAPLLPPEHHDPGHHDEASPDQPTEAAA
jgi:hypothetical protein